MKKGEKEIIERAAIGKAGGHGNEGRKEGTGGHLIFTSFFIIPPSTREGDTQKPLQPTDLEIGASCSEKERENLYS